MAKISKKINKYWYKLVKKCKKAKNCKKMFHKYNPLFF